MKILGILGLLLLPGAGPALQAQTPAAPIEIKLAHGDAAETQTRDQLLRLLRTNDVKPWIFTHNVIIDSAPDTVPHSHPVLTLSVRHLKDDDLLLSTFVHENLHHFLDQNHEKTEAAKKELRAVFPKVPVGYPDGADSEDSTYEHLIVCYLEYRADKELWGICGPSRPCSSGWWITIAGSIASCSKRGTRSDRSCARTGSFRAFRQ